VKVISEINAYEATILIMRRESNLMVKFLEVDQKTSNDYGCRRCLL
jgi:hypothetical protein